LTLAHSSASVGKQCVGCSKFEDHVWFEDWWMVASWCDE
jgi:hypothetical protein